MSPAAITLLLLGFAIISFVWEKIPLAMTAMIVCLALVLTEVLTPAQAFAGFVNTNVILFVGMFVIGGALFQTGMANTIGALVSRFARTEPQLIAAIMLITGFMSGILSNTGTAAVLIPVVIGIAARSGFARSRLLMPIVFAAALGGNLTLIGSTGNMIAQGALPAELRFGFFDFARVGLPVLLLGILYMSTIGYRLLPHRPVPKTDIVDPVASFADVARWKKIASLLVLIVTVVGMVCEKQIGIPLHITAVMGAVLLVVSRVITEKQAYSSIDAQTIVLFGAVLSLATAMESTGAGTLVAQWVLQLLGEGAPMFMIMLAIFSLSVALSNFMSNTATIALLVPIGLSISNSLGADPRAVLMAIVIGGSLGFATPVATPAGVMVLAHGRYSFMDYVRAGLPLILLSAIVSLSLLPILYPFFP